jgi:hypothetical protein
MADMTKKGRAPQGNRNSHAIVTEDDVRVIRKRKANGEPAKDIAKDYPVSGSQIYKIATGRAWKHVK